MTDQEHSTFEHIADESIAEYREKAEREEAREALKPEFEDLKEQVAELEKTEYLTTIADENPIAAYVVAVTSGPGGDLGMGQAIALLSDFLRWLETKDVVLAKADSAPEVTPMMLVEHEFQTAQAEMVGQFVEALSSASR